MASLVQTWLNSISVAMKSCVTGFANIRFFAFLLNPFILLISNCNALVGTILLFLTNVYVHKDALMNSTNNYYGRQHYV